jgi:hypothetical protein
MFRRALQHFAGAGILTRLRVGKFVPSLRYYLPIEEDVVGKNEYPEAGIQEDKHVLEAAASEEESWHIACFAELVFSTGSFKIKMMLIVNNLCFGPVCSVENQYYFFFAIAAIFNSQ